MTDLVFWHGWAMAPYVFTPLIDSLHRQNAALTCQTVALPGYVDTQKPNISTMTDWVDALMAEIGQPSVLVAWSMGAMLALDAAVRYPDKIQKLVLFGATPRFVNGNGWAYGLSPDTASRFKEGVKADRMKTLKRFTVLFNQKDIQAREITRFLGDIPCPAADGVLLQGLDFLHTADFRDVVPKIRQETLLIHGAHDPLMPVEAAKWLSQMIPHANLEIVPDAAHAPFLSNPAVCAQAIGRFLSWI